MRPLTTNDEKRRRKKEIPCMFKKAGESAMEISIGYQARFENPCYWKRGQDYHQLPYLLHRATLPLRSSKQRQRRASIQDAYHDSPLGPGFEGLLRAFSWSFRTRYFKTCKTRIGTSFTGPANELTHTADGQWERYAKDRPCFDGA